MGAVGVPGFDGYHSPVGLASVLSVKTPLSISKTSAYKDPCEQKGRFVFWCPCCRGHPDQIDIGPRCQLCLAYSRGLKVLEPSGFSLNRPS